MERNKENHKVSERKWGSKEPHEKAEVRALGELGSGNRPLC